MADDAFEAAVQAELAKMLRFAGLPTALATEAEQPVARVPEPPAQTSTAVPRHRALEAALPSYDPAPPMHAYFHDAGAAIAPRDRVDAGDVALSRVPAPSQERPPFTRRRVPASSDVEQPLIASAAPDDARAAARARKAAYALELERQMAEARQQKARSKQEIHASDMAVLAAERSAESSALPGGMGPPPRRGRRSVAEPWADVPGAHLRVHEPAPAPSPESVGIPPPGLSRRPSRYRDMSVDLLAAVDSMPPPVVDVPKSVLSTAAPVDSAAASPSQISGRMPALMDAESVSAAIQAGHTFTRYRFDRLPKEEQERAMAVHRAREIQAAELGAQVEERRLAKERAAREDAARDAAEDAQLARDREVVRQRQLAEIRASQDPLPVNEHAAPSGTHAVANDAAPTTGLPATAKKYVGTHEKLMALRRMREARARGEPSPPDPHQHPTHVASDVPRAGSFSPILVPDTIASPSRMTSHPRVASPEPPPQASTSQPSHAAHAPPAIVQPAPQPAYAYAMHAPTYAPPPPPQHDVLGPYSGQHIASTIPDALIHRMRSALAELEAVAATSGQRASANSAAPYGALGRGSLMTEMNAGAFWPRAGQPSIRSSKEYAWPQGLSQQPPGPAHDARGWQESTGPLPSTPSYDAYAPGRPAAPYVPSLMALPSNGIAYAHSDDAGDLAWVGSERPYTAMSNTRGRRSSAGMGVALDQGASAARVSGPRGKWALSFDPASHIPALVSDDLGASTRMDASALRQGGPDARLGASMRVDASLDSSTLFVFMDSLRNSTAALPAVHEDSHGPMDASNSSTQMLLAGTLEQTAKMATGLADEGAAVAAASYVATDRDETIKVEGTVLDGDMSAVLGDELIMPPADVEVVQADVALPAVAHEPVHASDVHSATMGSTRAGAVSTGGDYEDSFEADEHEGAMATEEQAAVPAQSAHRMESAASVLAADGMNSVNSAAPVTYTSPRRTLPLQHDVPTAEPSQQNDSGVITHSLSPKGISFAEIQAALERDALAATDTHTQRSTATSATAAGTTADLSQLDSTGKYARRGSWGLSQESVELHKRRLLAFYTLHAPAKAHKENVDHAWSLFGPRVWEELDRKYKGKTSGFAPTAAAIAAAEAGSAPSSRPRTADGTPS